jgi:hypothetical protein
MYFQLKGEDPIQTQHIREGDVLLVMKKCNPNNNNEESKLIQAPTPNESINTAGSSVGGDAVESEYFQVYIDTKKTSMYLLSNVS